MGFSRKFSCFIWTTNDCRRIPYEHYLTPLVIFHVWREFFREISNHSKLTLALHWDIVVNCFADELTNLCRVTASTCTACLSKTLIILHEGTTFLEIWGHVDWLFFFPEMVWPLPDQNSCRYNVCRRSKRRHILQLMCQ